MQKDSGPLVPLHWIGFGYAALVASGGIIGYAKAGSVPSLAAGLLFGGLAGLGAYQLSQDPRNIWVFLVTSGTLAGIMGMRFYHSGKFMPAGLIAGARMVAPLTETRKEEDDLGWPDNEEIWTLRCSWRDTDMGGVQSEKAIHKPRRKS
ncbi:transmembrane protein 14C isoform X2 [Sus scrofa]|uniref:transmembrane protein 14C isoform X2 n=1 Tax=Sus scrofa TaxID=9823 RepID=UPI000A2B16C8|nr:transmembrane protein 14C isoform X2 [Sus scrofa]